MPDETGGLIERAAALLGRPGSTGPEGSVAGRPRSLNQGGRANREDHPVAFEAPRRRHDPDGLGLDDDRVDLREVLAKFWVRKRLIFASMFFCTALAFIIAKLTTPLYTGVASVMIEPKQANTPGADANIGGMIEGGPSTMPTQALVLQSRDLVREVIERLHLDKDPEFNPSSRSNRLLALLSPITGLINRVIGFLTGAPGAGSDKSAESETGEAGAADGSNSRVVDQFIRRLHVALQEQSNIIDVSFSSQHPITAAAVANTLIQSYLDQLTSKREQVLGQESDRLDNVVLPALRRKMQASELALAEYRRKSGLVSNQNPTVLAQDLSDTKVQLALARARTEDAAVRLSQAQSGGSSVTASDSPTLQILREQVVGLQAQLAANNDTLGPSNPKTLQLESQLKELRAGIAREGTGHVGRLRAELAADSAREAALEQQVAEYTRQYAAVNGGDIELQSLIGRAEADQKIYEKYQARANDVRSNSNRRPDASFVSRAAVPLKPSFPPTPTIVLVGVALGAGAGIILAGLLDALASGLRNKQQVEDILGIRCLGSVPMIQGSGGRRPLAAELHRALRGSSLLRPSNTAFAQAVRQVQLRLQNPSHNKAPQVVLITAALPEEGKTWAAASLAACMAADGHKVVLVDCDLQRPTVHRVFDGPREPGLTDYFAGGIGLDGVIHQDPDSGVRYIPVGTAQSKDAWRITSDRMQALVNSLRAQNTFIILDSAPVLAISDAVLLSQIAQKTILVIKWGSTPPAVARHAATQLLETGGAEVAALLTMVNTKRAARFGDPIAGVYKRLERYYGAENARE